MSLYLKKYGKSFITQVKEFSAATVETSQLSDNTFSTLAENAANQTGLKYNPPRQVNYGDEVNVSWTTTGTLANSPVDQCQFFEIFANDTKLVEGSDNNYTINYATGVITFNDDMTRFIIVKTTSF